jgi:hypothetical protein
MTFWVAQKEINFRFKESIKRQRNYSISTVITTANSINPSGGSRLKVGMVVITLFLRPKIR